MNDLPKGVHCSTEVVGFERIKKEPDASAKVNRDNPQARGTSDSFDVSVSEFLKLVNGGAVKDLPKEFHTKYADRDYSISETGTLADCLLDAWAYTKGYPHEFMNRGGTVPNVLTIGEGIPMSDYVYFFGGYPASGEGYDYTTTKLFLEERGVEYEEDIEKRGNKPGLWIEVDLSLLSMKKPIRERLGDVAGKLPDISYYFIFDQTTGELLETVMGACSPSKYGN